jgi:hypothetical protein
MEEGATLKFARVGNTPTGLDQGLNVTIRGEDGSELDGNLGHRCLLLSSLRHHSYPPTLFPSIELI